LRNVVSLQRRIKSFFTYCSMNLHWKPIIFNNSIKVEISYNNANMKDLPKNIISKYHLTSHISHLKMPWNITFQHRDNTTHDSTAVIIKNNIWHHELDNFKRNFLQATKNWKNWRLIRLCFYFICILPFKTYNY
jgi:hypothetical protein